LVRPQARLRDHDPPEVEMPVGHLPPAIFRDIEDELREPEAAFP